MQCNEFVEKAYYNEVGEDKKYFVLMLINVGVISYNILNSITVYLPVLILLKFSKVQPLYLVYIILKLIITSRYVVMGGYIIIWSAIVLKIIWFN
jgi:hypothetical protein